MSHQHPVYRRIVVKVGTNVITGRNGKLDPAILDSLTSQIAALMQDGVEVILVTSGAVSAGRGIVSLSGNLTPVETRQVLAATGQIRLINAYNDRFKKHGITGAQLLVTKGDFRDRQHYLNMRTCFEALLQQKIVPIVNENDAVAITELMFTDNDELSGLIASMLQVDANIILSNVDGLFDTQSEGNPVIEEIDPGTKNFSQYIRPGKSEFGRGGMLTKCNIAHKLSRLGITVHIANGTTPGILQTIAHGGKAGTKFIAQKPKQSRKRWVALSEGLEKGAVIINQGAIDALTSGQRATSLLPVGITGVEGSFQRGDIIRICSTDGKVIGYGMASCTAEKARSAMGQKGLKPVIHYDHLYLVP
ncbi:MAG TPA: glutamate 5-kinase [Chlorobaculum sp.]|jgi:glutamate 5-kinase|uniref:Glutamate 5-kinase n=1 Tax=Chlorobaculum tepidum (strain ATCC 49652 / DSM 12025 / NBRC 103806 / TLS) TaxID=194439 RepID=PROB_CHLTE|nr:glutamate 5-kinase [Chlorobaculum tepidum]Q8KCG4.1 RecName: Full=Glutamate 5-kinase; AltName: Full=Gamma-glutamyl kinase; Short=GK [Chlorobaculum tepidum TLS]AAM72685.1 glutamate 5-kinase [Chlorobaculum tepidum TLS]HBU22653.1 glutamate 5-kinase [Chlorobaculum sp.]